MSSGHEDHSQALEGWKQEAAVLARRKKWDERFLTLASDVAGWSKDPSTQVGAVIVDTECRVLSLGYNGFPRGIDDSVERLGNRETKYSLIVHAEANAILNAPASSVLEGATIYVTHAPCAECAKTIIQAGIERVVYSERLVNWGDSQGLALELFDEVGMSVSMPSEEG